MMISASTALLPAALLCVLFLIWLNRAGYPKFAAVLLSALVFIQSGVLRSLTEPGHSLWLSVGVGAVAASASAFLGRDDARSVILVGGSLAAIQICDPMGGLVAAGVVPVAIVAVHDDANVMRSAGLYSLLFFLPVMTALILLYLTRVLHIDPAQVLGAASAPRRWRSGALGRFAPAVALGVVLLPLLPGLRFTRQGRATLLVSGTLIVSAAFDGILGVWREPVTLLAAAAPLTVGALAARPASSDRNRRAFVVAGLCVAVSWIVLLWFLPARLTGLEL